MAQSIEPFNDPNWLFEIKSPGFRSLVYVFGDRCQLVSRKGYVYKSPVFNQLCAAIAAGVKGKNAVLDGEICCLGSDGRSIFSDLVFRRKQMAYFCAFDLLWLNGKDYRTKPLIERKMKLRWLISNNPQPLIYTSHVEAKGIELFEEVCRLNMEGIVAKHREGLYVSDARETTWIIINNPDYSILQSRHELLNLRKTARD
jgi:bifunctional non-homologous end joining protein LigD